MRTRMTYNLIVCFFCWVIGYFILSFVGVPETGNRESEIVSKTMQFSNIYIWSWSKAMDAFVKIGYKNMFVAFLLSFVGYYSAGILSVVILFFNGLILKITIMQLPSSWTYTYILSYFWHAPLEILAFSWFGAIGLLGFRNIHTVWVQGELDYGTPLQIDIYIKPFILLLLANLLESIQFAIDLTLWL